MARKLESIAERLAKLNADYATLAKDCDDYYRDASHNPKRLRYIETKLRRIARTIQRTKQAELPLVLSHRYD
jgi:uncharacterized protein (UPF0335 family)